MISAFIKYAKKEFAPGIPLSREKGKIRQVENRESWPFVIHDHEAERAGRHFDMRLLDPETKQLLSWAIPKQRVPSPGEKLLAVRQPDHTEEYIDFTGDIKSGYGKGKVKAHIRDDVEVHRSGEDDLGFTLFDGRDNEFRMKRLSGNDWLLMNVTKTKKTAPVPTWKPKYKDIAPENIDVKDDSQILMPKVDGAHVTVLLEKNKPPRVFSVRESKKTNDLIEHTHKFSKLIDSIVTKELDKTILRGEAYAVDKKGKSIPAKDVSAILNSSTRRALAKQKELGELKLGLFGVSSYKNKPMSDKPINKQIEILDEVKNLFPQMDTLPVVSDPKDKRLILDKIEKGKYPLTREGVVLFPTGGGIPIKSKFKPDYDIIVRRIFEETGKRKGLAGGFEYSWTPEGQIEGRVGTGFNHALKKDMLKNPEKYLKRVARVQALDLFKNKDGSPGALRAPSFKDWHPDHPLEEA